MTPAAASSASAGLNAARTHALAPLSPQAYPTAPIAWPAHPHLSPLLPARLCCTHACSLCAGAVQLRNAMTERFGVELPPTAALDYPTVLALAGFVAHNVAPAAAGGALAAADAGFELDDSYWSDYSGEQILDCSLR